MVWVLAFLLMMLVMAGMAVGVMMGRKPIAGSCGGIGSMGIDQSCAICGGNPAKCEENDGSGGDARKAGSLGYDATKVD